MQKSVDEARAERPAGKATLEDMVQACLSSDLIVQEKPFIYLETPKDFWGLCRVASEAMYWLSDQKYRPMYHPELKHWWLENEENKVIVDLTKQYFTDEELLYMWSNGEEYSFGDHPSPSAQEVIRRVHRWL